jgi:ribosomal protein L11 methyltransferase
MSASSSAVAVESTVAASPLSFRTEPLDHASARVLAETLETGLWPPPDAITLELADPESDLWAVDAIFGSPPDEGQLAVCLAAAGLVRSAVAVVNVPDVDWIAATLRELGPVRVGRFLLHGSHNREVRSRASVAIEIEAGTAFGTGHHGSTLGCLIALDALLKQARPRRVLDVGCGTGVLAIAACRAIHALTTATDNDPEAVRVARDNARLNRARIAIYRAEGVRHPRIRGRAPYDIILANILARPLTSLAADFGKLAATGGLVVLAGLRQSQERSVLAAYRDRGFRLVRRIRLEGWSTMVLRAPGRRAQK